MSGQIKSMIDKIILERGKGDPLLINTTKTKLILKGINPDSYTASSDDDASVIAKLNELGKELGITL